MNIIPYGRQYIDNQDIKFVSKALKQDLITTGNYVKKFEDKISKFLKTIELAYKKSKYFDLYFDNIKKIINNEYKFLSQLNIDIIERICGFLNIGKKLTRVSFLNLDSSISKIDLLDFICKKKIRTNIYQR